MKKIRVIYQSIVFTLVAVSVIMFSGLAQAATATVDGFVGVPWGASKDQVAAAMAQRGFKQVDELTLYGSRYLVYRGTFADEPAELVFVVGTNGFNRGSADLLNYRSELWHHCYEKIERLIAVKYGSPYLEGKNPTSVDRTWYLQTGGPQPVPAKIIVGGGNFMKSYFPMFGPDKQVPYLACWVSYEAEIVKDSY